jgi:hypothetical protein
MAQTRASQLAELQAGRKAIVEATAKIMATVKGPRGDEGGLPLMDTDEVAAQFLISIVTLTKWVRDPKLGFPRPFMLNGKNEFIRAEIDSFRFRLEDMVRSAKTQGVEGDLAQLIELYGRKVATWIVTNFSDDGDVD